MKRNYNNPIGFLDVLFLTLVGFIFILCVSMMLIKPEQKQDGIKPKAEFVIKLSWDNANTSDVDVWVRDPAGNVCFFREKEVGLMHLDRDDLGKQNDTIIMPDGKEIIFPYNEELLILRGIMEGEYVINVHLFSINTNINKRRNKLLYQHNWIVL